MTWKSHIAFASAITIPFNPALLLPAVVGSTAPDWSEYILKFFGIDVKHRGATHYLLVPIVIITISFIIDYKDALFWFGVGYLSHWFADSLTISGVPLSPWDTHPIHFFGGKIRTGDPVEYIITFSLLLAALLIGKPTIELISGSDDNSFNVFSMDYKELYDKNIIDEMEYREKRFKFF